jgi:hypothetical protein
LCFDSLNFKKKINDKTKNSKPNNLLSGHIARDLNVGDMKITEAVIAAILTFKNLNLSLNE